jgi:hypothetical protein
MRYALLRWLAIALLAASAPASAQVEVADPVRVEIDWSGVSDADVTRCGLSRLRAGTIERLVSQGYAIVSAVDASGIGVTVTSAEAGLLLRVRAEGAAREQAMPAPEPCDATFALDVIARIAELVDEVAQSRSPSAAPAAIEGDEATTGSRPAGTQLVLSVDATGRIAGSPDLARGAGLGVRARMPSAASLGGRLELALDRGHGVAVYEGLLAATAAYVPGVIGPCAELGPMLHVASSDLRSVTKLDATLGLGAQLELDWLFAQALLYGRLRRLEHRKGTEVAYDSGRFGLVLRLGAQL